MLYYYYVLPKYLNIELVMVVALLLAIVVALSEILLLYIEQFILYSMS